MNFKINDRVLAATNILERIEKVGTIVKIDGDSYTVQLDENKTLHEVTERQLTFIREEIRTDPNSCNGLLICKNCGWSASSHVWFSPHFCKEKITREGKQVLQNSIFEAYVIMPVRMRPKDNQLNKLSYPHYNKLKY